MKTITTLALLLLLAASSSFAAGGNVKLYGDLEFPDSTIQKTATVQGPVGLQGAPGDTGPQGPAGPTCKPTLTDICEGILAAGAVRPSYCPAVATSVVSTIAKPSLVTGETTTVSSTFKTGGVAVVGVTVTFTTTLGSVTPITAVTNSSGTATAQLTAGAAAGQGQVTATATVSGIIVTSNALFNENLPKLSPITFGLDNLSYGGSTSVSVTLKDPNGSAYTGPELNVVFSKSSTTATITSTIKTIKGVATTTYLANTTIGVDTITATIPSDTVTADITVGSPSANSIQFVSVNPTNIGLKGMGETGSPETALLTFKVFNTLGQAKAYQQVDFKLNTTVGGLTLSSASGSTAADGTVSVYVNAGTIATSVRVTASITGSVPLIATQSNQLVVSTGVPAQDGFTLSGGIIIETIPGTPVTVAPRTFTVSMTDHFHNPVPVGTAVYFTTSHGTIPPSCTTLGTTGSCTVQWSSTEPLLSSPTILAYAIGEEAFLDVNGNGVADSVPTSEFISPPAYLNPPFDTSEAFRDDNGNGVRDANETFIDFNGDGIFNGPDGKYNGVLQGAAYIGAPKTKHIFQNSHITLASGIAQITNSCATGNNISLPVNSSTVCNFSASNAAANITNFTFDISYIADPVTPGNVNITPLLPNEVTLTNGSSPIGTGYLKVIATSPGGAKTTKLYVVTAPATSTASEAAIITNSCAIGTNVSVLSSSTVLCNLSAVNAAGTITSYTFNVSYIPDPLTPGGVTITVITPDKFTLSNVSSPTGTGYLKIIATSPGGIQTTQLYLINSPAANLIQLVSATPTTIGLKGMGIPGFAESSLVTFRLLNTLSKPMAYQLVNFSLDTSIGGLSLSTSSATTAADGTVYVTVNAGTIATNVKVTATVANSSRVISAQSGQIIVSTVIPAQDGFTLSVGSNVIEVNAPVPVATRNISVSLNDHFHNPAAAGTNVYFTTSHGTIDPSCTTVGTTGACSVTWYNTEPFLNYPTDKKITILAYAVGEEAFLDINGNGVADAGEFADTSEAFRDDNGNGVRDSNETFIDFNGDGNFNGPDGKYNGVLQGSAYVSAPKTKHIFANEIVTSASGAAVITNSCATGNTITISDATTMMCNISAANTDNNITNYTFVITYISDPLRAGITITTITPNIFYLTDSATAGIGKGQLMVVATSPSGVVTTQLYSVN